MNVSATPGSDFGLPGSLEITPPLDTGSSTPSFDLPSALPPAATAPAQHLVAAPKSPAPAPKRAAAPLALEPASTSYPDSVPGGWLVIGVIGMMMAGMGLHQLRGRALSMAGAATTCPLERGTP